MVDRRADPTPRAGPADIRQALSAVVDSAEFARSDRLKAFLTYIVEETLAGRSDAILGKTIAQDVYHRDTARTENAENLVRVDAGRLRRKLEAYYAGEGARDALRIVVHPGGYAPRFVAEADAGDAAPARARSRPAVALAAAFGLALLAAGAWWWWSQRDVAVPAPHAGTEIDAREVQRQALAAKSAASVRAVNLCDQARGFLFPIAETGSQRTAEDIFARAIETDPGMACGYAGRAHALATLARLAGPDPTADALRRQASRMAARAVALAPTSGWSQSAAAWTAYAENDLPEAERLSRLSVELSPRDRNVLDFRALIAVGTGDFEEALAATDPGLRRDYGSLHDARRNIRAVAQFHLGAYGRTIASLESAIRAGDPVSALTLIYLAAAHYRNGNPGKADAYVAEMLETWPDARPEEGLRRLYASDALAQDVLEPLTAAGFQPRDSEF